MNFEGSDATRGVDFTEKGVERIREIAREEIERGPDAVMHYSTSPVGLCCALCLVAIPGEAPPADTIIAGTAVCVRHVGYVASGDFGRLVALVKDHET